MICLPALLRRGLPCLGLLLTAGVAAAQTTASWVAAGDGFYDEPANWSTGRIPGAPCCETDAAEFNAGGQADVYLPLGETLAPDALRVEDAAIDFRTVIGVGGAEFEVTSELHLNSGGRLGVHDKIRLAAQETVIGVGASTTELAFRAGSAGELGVVTLGGGGNAGGDSSLVVWPGAQVEVGGLSVGDGSAAGQSSIVQVEGLLNQSAGAETTVGGGQGLSRLFAFGGEVRFGGDVHVESAGGIVNSGGVVVFGGDTNLVGAASSYLETQGSGAARQFATGSVITIGEGATATFDSAPLMLDDAQTLTLHGALITRGDLVTAGDTSLQTQLDPSAAPAPLRIGGAATLAGDLVVTWPSSEPAPAVGFSAPLLTAGGGVSGQFATATLPRLPGLLWRLDYEPDGVNLVALATPPGDYNSDGAVDAADYTVWRDTLNSATDLAADGDGDGVVEIDDYFVWRNAMQTAAPPALAAAPEPAACLVVLLLAPITAPLVRVRPEQGC